MTGHKITPWWHVDRRIAPVQRTRGSSNSILRWRAWVGGLYNFISAIKETDGAVQRSLLLHFGGAELRKTFQYIPNIGDENDFEAAIRELDNYSDPHLKPDRE